MTVSAPPRSTASVAVRRPHIRVAPARKPLPKRDFKAPGEDVRNGVSIFNMIFGNIVTAGQSLQVLARTTFANPAVQALASGLVRVGDQVGHMPFLSQPLAKAGFRTAARVLPWVSAGLLCFDGYAAWHTLHNPQASLQRKGLTLARFFCNAVATGLSFAPGVGFVYAIVPALVGNVFEFAIMHMNAKGQR